MILRLEATKTWRSFRPHLAFLTVLLFLGLMLLGFWMYASNETSGAAEFRYTFENSSYFNGLTFALYAFYFGFLLVLPIFAVTEGGAQLAGETAGGTLLLLLTRPIGRSQVFLTKLLLGICVAALLVFGLWLLSLLVGLFTVGFGDLDLYPGVLQMTDRHQHLPQAVALQRFLMILPAAWIAMCVPLTFSFLVSSWSRTPVNAVVASMAVYLVLYVIAEIHFFTELRPWLFTTHMPFWRELFQENIDWLQVMRDAAKLLGFSLLFSALALHRFRTREEA
jgi:ABC-2 type transport system permease protein